MLRNNNLKFIRKILRTLEKYGFYVMQLIILVIIWVFYVNDYLLPVDIDIRAKFIQLRNDIIGNAEINKSNISLVALDSKFFEKEDISVQGLHRGYYAQALRNINKYDPALVVMDVFFQKKYNFKGNNKKINALNQIFGQFDKDLAKEFNEKTILAGLYNFNENRIIKPDKFFLQNGSKYGHIHSLKFYMGTHLGPYGILKDKLTKEEIYPLGIITFAEYITNKFKKQYLDTENLSYKIKDSNNFIEINLPGNNIYKIPKNKYKGDDDFIFHPIYFRDSNQLKTKQPNGEYLDTKQDQYISLYDAYTGNISETEIKDKIIFIGATDVALNDIKKTLLGDIEGVLQHINLFLSLQNNDFIYILNKEKKTGILPPIDQHFIVIFGIIFLNLIAILWLRKTKAHTHILLLMIIEIFIIFIIGILLAIEGIVGIFHLGYSLFLPLGSIIILIFLQTVLTGLYSYIDTFQIKESFENLFRVYVGNNKAKEKQSGSIDAEEKIAKKTNAAIFFSDIVDFTNISESLNPEDNIKMLNIYLEQMTQKIQLYNGTLDKFIGDAIMAYWTEDKDKKTQKNSNAGKLCNLAAKTAILNIISLEKVNKDIQKELSGENIPDNLLNSRIGLHFGEVIEGDIGSRQRIDLTIIGDNVNLASRLEGINKFYNTHIIMSSNFHEYLSNEFIRRKIDRIKVKGKKSAIEIYQLFPFYTNMKSQNELEKLYKFIEQFEDGLEKYFNGKFAEALNIFKENNSFYPDPTTEIMIKRVGKLLINEPNKWNGVWTYEMK